MLKDTEKMIDQATSEDYRFLFVERSGNKKTGIMSQTYTATCNGRDGSCPHCPFKDHGCYAENFMVNENWKKVPLSGKNIQQLREAIEGSKKKTDYLRHNIAGDLAVEGTSQINKALLEELTDIYSKNFKAAYSYTHCEINKRNLKLVKAAADKNFVINFSTENTETAKKVIQAGCNAVIACNTISNKVVKKDGLTIVQCPATIDPEKNHCSTCGLCWQKDRKVVVAFPVHGCRKNAAKKAGFLTDL